MQTVRTLTFAFKMWSSHKCASTSMPPAQWTKSHAKSLVSAAVISFRHAMHTSRSRHTSDIRRNSCMLRFNSLARLFIVLLYQKQDIKNTRFRMKARVLLFSVRTIPNWSYSFFFFFRQERSRHTSVIRVNSWMMCFESLARVLIVLTETRHQEYSIPNESKSSLIFMTSCVHESDVEVLLFFATGMLPTQPRIFAGIRVSCALIRSEEYSRTHTLSTRSGVVSHQILLSDGQPNVR